MFTGIVEERGRLFWTAALRDAGNPNPVGTEVFVRCPKVAADANAGDSIAVDGVCLTIVDRRDDTLTFDLSPETLERTTFGLAPPRSSVNLERPVTLASRLGGHLVQGHVDGVGTVEAVDPGEDGGAVMRIRPPEQVARYLVQKGSVAVDGVSLTVAGADGETFEVALIPHTLEVTTLGERAPGDPVNLEVDLVAKYVERLVRSKG